MIVRHRFPTATYDRGIDRAFEQLTNSMFEAPRRQFPAVTGAWRDGAYVLTVDLPGVSAEAVKVEVSGVNLTLSAQTESLDWQRSVRLGEQLDPNKVSARHLDGRLTVVIGTHDEPEVRQVAISVTAPEAIETSATDESTDDQSSDTNSTD